MIRKSGHRFSEKIMLKKKMIDEHDSTQLKHALEFEKSIKTTINNIRRNTMKRRDFIKLSAGLGATMAATTPLSSAFAQTKMVLKASDVHPLGYPTVEAVVRMGKKLEAATNGRLTIQMFPSMQLGGEKEMIEQAQLGALQIARISVGAVGPVVDDVNVFNLPFIFRDEQHMRKVIDGPIGEELLEKISANPNTRLVALGWMDAGTRNVYSNKAVTKPADLK